ncbi:3452_t:CDS:2, partial [Entrophospora sp. SA101]
YVNKPSIPLHNQVFIPPPEQQQLLQECKSLILSRQQNPSDLTNQNQITYLQKLSEALQQKFVTNEEIQQIRQMLAANMILSPNFNTIQQQQQQHHQQPATSMPQLHLINNNNNHHHHNTQQQQQQQQQQNHHPLSPLFTNIINNDKIFNVKDLEKIQLTRVVAILYDALPSQCKQCGIRYAKDSKKIGIHLDWHFRQNRKMKEKAKKAQSRSCNNNNNNDLINESTVVVPLDIEKTNKPCPICKEKFQVFWNDNEEEWMFRNAVEINDGIICHATCHADALK